MENKKKVDTKKIDTKELSPTEKKKSSFSKKKGFFVKLMVIKKLMKFTMKSRVFWII